MQQIPPAQLGEATRWGSIWGGHQADPSGCGRERRWRPHDEPPAGNCQAPEIFLRSTPATVGSPLVCGIQQKAVD